MTQTTDLLTRLEAGIEEVRQSDLFLAYLRTAARFHRYSFGNTILIALQKPDAQAVAGFHRWLELGRHVRKGEKGIAILAPCAYKRGSQDDENEAQTAVFFKAVHVFDVSQTEGEDLPMPTQDLEGDDCGIYNRLAAVAAAEGLSITSGHETTAAHGYYVRSEGRIWISPELSPLQAAKTLAHELSHHFADHPAEDCRGEKETVAEASAFIVMAHFGQDAGAYSFGYLASWADSKTFKAKLAEIQRTASVIIITAIENQGKEA